MGLLQSRDLVQIHLTVPVLVQIHLIVPHQLVNHLLVLPLRHGCHTANIIHASGQKYIQYVCSTTWIHRGILVNQQGTRL